MSEPTYFSDGTCETTHDSRRGGHIQLALGFDEAITGRSFTDALDGFELVGFDATRASATAAQLSDANDSVALVCFDVDDWTNATTVTVRRDTVGDVGDLGNPEGALGTTSVTLSGTTAPELVSITPESATLVTFTFDEPVAAASATGYRLIASDGSHVTSTAAVASGDTDVDVTFPDYTDLTITRAAALDGAATGEGTDPNAVSVIEVSGSGLTAAPDLASVSYVEDATRVRDTDDGDDQTVQVDEVRFAFDVSVLDEADNLEDFVLVTADGSTLTPTVNEAPADSTEDPVERSSADARVVVVEFADGALQTTTGAAVLDSAVRAAGGAQPVNRVDAMARSPQLTYAAGQTLAPAPTAVEISSSNVILGTTYTVTLTFDEPVARHVLPLDGLAVRRAGPPVHDHRHAEPRRDDPTVVTVTSSPLSGTNDEIAEGAVLVGLAPDTVSDAEGHGSHAQVVAP